MPRYREICKQTRGMSNKFKITRNIAMGLALSFLFAWAASYFFCDSLVAYSKDKLLGFYVYRPGMEYLRSEGWGNTTIQKHGIIGANDYNGSSIRSKRDIIAIWGNSYVEAFQLNDNEKIGARVNYFLKQDGINDSHAIQIGWSGSGMADYCYKIPRYKAIYPHITRYYIILGGVDDVWDMGHLYRVSYSSRPCMRDLHFRPAWQHIKVVLETFRMAFVWNILKKDVFTYTANDILHPEATKAHSLTDHRRPHHEKVCAFLLDKLQAETGGRLTIIYCPQAPNISGGKVGYKDPDSRDADIIAQQCNQRGIEFINMRKAFCEYFKKNIAFVRGFPNSEPANGHLNAAGDNLVAKAIVKSLLAWEKRRCSSTN